MILLPELSKNFTEVTECRLARLRESEERRAERCRAERLRRARTFVEFIRALGPEAAEVIAQSPALGGLVRRAEFARRKGISREYARVLIKTNRLFTVRVGGVEWVSDPEEW